MKKSNPLWKELPVNHDQLPPMPIFGFVAGTPIRTPEGSKPIEDVKPGDLIGSAPGAQVEEVFQTEQPIFLLRLGGRVIRMMSTLISNWLFRTFGDGGSPSPIPGDVATAWLGRERGAGEVQPDRTCFA